MKTANSIIILDEIMSEELTYLECEEEKTEIINYIEVLVLDINGDVLETIKWRDLENKSEEDILSQTGIVFGKSIWL
jgi:hypothetical protein